MTGLKVLCIGDPHFKADNAVETELMTQELVKLIEAEQPDLTVVLGDIGHTHEKLNLHIVARIMTFLRTMKQVSRKLVVLIGNHDRANNNVFLTPEHGFVALEEWDRTVLVDTVKVWDEVGRDGHTYRLVGVPYVNVGRLEEALATAELKLPLEGVAAVFAHQEFKGAQMGAIISEHGDVWPPEAPLCISGHIHDFQDFHEDGIKLIYTGTPIQHGFGDRPDKTVSIIEFTSSSNEVKYNHRRITLAVPRKMTITLTPEELAVYVPPPGVRIRLKLVGSTAAIRDVLALEQVKAIVSQPTIKLVIVDTTPLGRVVPSGGNEVPAKQSFTTRLTAILQRESPEVRQAFTHVTGLSL